MATLPPSLLSDDEDEPELTTSIGTKSKKTKKDVSVVSSDDDDDDDEELNTDFEFGGLLGEDGNSSLLQLNPQSSIESWSYTSALSLLQQNDNDKSVPRTPVASLIAAQRSNLIKQRKDDLEERNGLDAEMEVENDEDKIEKSGSGSDSENEKSGDSENEKSGSENDSDSKSGSDSDDSDSDSDDDLEKVDDADKATRMESDLLREREGKQKKKKSKRGKAKVVEEVEADDNSTASSDRDDDDDDDSDDSDDEKAPPVDSEAEAAKVEAEKASKFFESSIQLDKNRNSSSTQQTMFSQMNLSRPLLRSIAAMGYVTPTPIQSSVIPLAMAGRDVCASAVTGSGKTAAFLLPILERICQRKPRSTKGDYSATRALILCPTRELAAQCVSMGCGLTRHCHENFIRICLIVGGSKNVAAQAAELRSRPDVLVATPGRLLDHLLNSSGFDLEDLELLVLDEADRLLDLGFLEELEQILKFCEAGQGRQTMLFSATMEHTKVDDLIAMSLKRPVRVNVSEKSKESSTGNSVEVAPRLEQEFVRIRGGNEHHREAMLLALLTRTFTQRTICFFDTKVLAHRLMILCGLCGLQCGELHGNLTQVQRLEALEQFRRGEVRVLLATDLAARGLDVEGVEAVINFEMPGLVPTYVHRIGRTARAGRRGTACTLIGEGRRTLMKEVIRDANDKKSRSSTSEAGVIRSRTIPPSVITHFSQKIKSLEPHIREVRAAEEVARLDRIAEMEMTKAQNFIKHSDDIQARPKKEWFKSERAAEEKEAKAQAKLDKEKENLLSGKGLHRMTRKKRRRREAMMEAEEYQEELRQSREDEGLSEKKNPLAEGSIQGGVRAAKRKEAHKEKDVQDRSLAEDDAKRKAKQLKKEKLKLKAKAELKAELAEEGEYMNDEGDMMRKRKKVKSRYSADQDALGDGSLFDDERIAYQKPQAKTTNTPNQVEKSAYQFTAYDPNKKYGKHGKASHHGFKSKSKFKRR